MAVERFERERHYADFEKWYSPHVEVVMGPDFLPKVGFVAPGVAMAFLYQTDSKIAFIEALIANPDVKGDARSAGIDEVVGAVIAEARTLGFKALIAQTDMHAVAKRARRLGFVADAPTSYQMLYML